MAMRAKEDEKAIVNAFLRAGHPWMAFGTVIVRSWVRIVVAVAVIVMAVNQIANLPALLELLPG